MSHCIKYSGKRLKKCIKTIVNSTRFKKWHLDPVQQGCLSLCKSLQIPSKAGNFYSASQDRWSKVGGWKYLNNFSLGLFDVFSLSVYNFRYFAGMSWGVGKNSPDSACRISGWRNGKTLQCWEKVGLLAAFYFCMFVTFRSN